MEEGKNKEEPVIRGSDIETDHGGPVKGWKSLEAKPVGDDEEGGGLEKQPGREKRVLEEGVGIVIKPLIQPNNPEALKVLRAMQALANGDQNPEFREIVKGYLADCINSSGRGILPEEAIEMAHNVMGNSSQTK